MAGEKSASRGGEPNEQNEQQTGDAEGQIGELAANGESEAMVETGKDMKDAAADFTDRVSSGEGAGSKFQLLQRMKIGISWLQCLGPFIFTFDIPWPAQFADQLAIIYNVFAVDLSGLFGNIGEISCELDTSFLAGFFPHMMALPALLGATLLGFLVGALFGPARKNLKQGGCCRKKAKSKFARSLSQWGLVKETLPHNEAALSRAIQVMLFLTFLLYPGLCSKLFRVFKCVEINGRIYLAADLSVECWTGKHQQYSTYALIFIAVYVLGIPLWLWSCLYRHRNEIMANPDNPSIRARWGQLYSSFNPDDWYWELVEMGRKCVLTGGLVLVADGSPVQIFLGIVVCMVYQCMHLHAQPLKRWEDNLMQEMAGWHLLCTLVTGIWIALSKAVAEHADFEGKNPYHDILVSVLLQGALFVMMAMWAWMLVYETAAFREATQGGGQLVWAWVQEKRRGKKGQKKTTPAPGDEEEAQANVESARDMEPIKGDKLAEAFGAFVDGKASVGILDGPLPRRPSHAVVAEPSPPPPQPTPPSPMPPSPVPIASPRRKSSARFEEATPAYSAAEATRAAVRAAELEWQKAKDREEAIRAEQWEQQPGFFVDQDVGAWPIETVQRYATVHHPPSQEVLPRQGHSGDAERRAQLVLRGARLMEAAEAHQSHTDQYRTKQTQQYQTHEEEDQCYRNHPHNGREEHGNVSLPVRSQHQQAFDALVLGYGYGKSDAVEGQGAGSGMVKQRAAKRKGSHPTRLEESGHSIGWGRQWDKQR
jgi:hypothetical protein